MSERNKSDHVWWNDYESGQWIRITRKEYEAIQENHNMMNKFIEAKLNMDGKRKGVIQIFSTMADDNKGHEDFKNLWEDNQWSLK